MAAADHLRKYVFHHRHKKYFTWGSRQTTSPIRCSQCNIVAPFTGKTGMNFLTLFFIMPTIPISSKKKLIECPNCKARFQTE
ncbi:MAG: zinc ribbon domain-containing protein [Pyrinomonadaceae bacterium]|nr:zinc ribbon domain-containing protein [Pyrinomonadaceae bacterium]